MKKDDPNERERRTLGKSIRALWDAIAKSREAPVRWRGGRSDTPGKHTGHNRRKYDAARLKRRRRMIRASRRANRRSR